METSALTNDGLTKIKVTYNPNGINQIDYVYHIIRECFESNLAAQRNKKRAHWPSDRGDFCEFVLYKENRDNANAAAVIAKFLQ